MSAPDPRRTEAVGAAASAQQRRPLPAFPASVLEPHRRRWHDRLRTLAVGVVAIAVLAGGVAISRQVTAGDGPRLRTAIATTQAVAERYEAVAAIEPVTRAQLAFPMAGTVRSVDVTVGDVVELGQTLATLDTVELERAVRRAESDLAAAQLDLNIALSGEYPSSGATGDAGAISLVGLRTAGDVVFGYASTRTDALTYLLAGTSDEAAAARQTLVSALDAASGAANLVAAKRDSASSICGAVNVSIDPDDPDGSISTIGSSLGSCRSALDELLAAQDQLAAAQSQVDAAAATLDSVLNGWAAELEHGTSTTSAPAPPEPSAPDPTQPAQPDETTPADTETSEPPPSDSTTPAAPDETGGSPDADLAGIAPPGGGGMSSPSGGFGGATASGVAGTADPGEPTSAELIAYQAAYTAAERSLDAARQALARATLVSPISGTVVAVGIAPGDAVTSASDTQTIIVRGDTGYEATLAVSVDDIDRITIGQQAELVPDGTDTGLDGEVVAISAVPDTTGSTVSYRVTVGLDAKSTGLRDGNIGDVAIITDHRDDAVAVPTSAITPTAAGHTVDIVTADGQVTTVGVEIGAVGPEWTEIRDGLTVGDIVVIADPTEPLPGTATATSGTGTGTGIGFPSGGLPAGGGFPAGGPPR